MELEAEMGGGIQTATLAITPEILRLIAEIDEFKGAWAAIGRISPDRLTSLRQVATIESIGSSTRIEGAKLSDREVERHREDEHPTDDEDRRRNDPESGRDRMQRYALDAEDNYEAAREFLALVNERLFIMAWFPYSYLICP